MIRLKKHIAIALLGLFCFPILFQPIHVLRHQAHGHHHVCHSPQHNSDKEGYGTHEKTWIADTSCPICDYQFAISKLTELAYTSCDIAFVNFPYNEIVVPQQHTHKFSQTPSRAPPLLFS